jgi:hypothetical protein
MLRPVHPAGPMARGTGSSGVASHAPTACSESDSATAAPKLFPDTSKPALTATAKSSSPRSALRRWASIQTGLIWAWLLGLGRSVGKMAVRRAYVGR